MVKLFKLSIVSSLKRERIIEDMKKDEESLRENRWSYMILRIIFRKSLGVYCNVV